MSWPILLLQAASLVLALTVAGWTLALAAVGEWRMTVRESLVSAAQANSPWLERVIWHLPAKDWMPLPWERRGDVPDLLRAIAASNGRALETMPLPEPSADGGNSVRRYFEGWGAARAFCASLGVQYPHEAAQVCGEYETPDSEWIRLFAEHFATDLAVTERFGRVVVSERPAQPVRLCNLAPFAVRIARVADVASENAVRFYRETLQMPAGGFHITGWEELQAGACVHTHVAGIDRQPEVYLHARPEEPAFAAWLEGVWTRYYLPELDADAVAEAQAGGVAGYGCTLNGSFEWVTDAPDECMGDARSTPFVGGLRLENPEQFFAFTYPGFSGYESALNTDGTGIDEQRLAESLEATASLHRLAQRQFELQRAWAFRTPRFLLGAELEDVNGPLLEGVEAHGIPQQTILGDWVDIPSAGVLLGVNDEPVHGVEDVHELFEAHGGSRAAGIMKMLKLRLFDGNDTRDYFTAFRFNPNAAQEFDTNVGFWTGFVEGFFFNQEVLACGFDLECAWIAEQRNAFARQVAPEEFAFGEGMSMFVPVGGWVGRSLRMLSGVRRASVAAKLLSAPVAEAGVESLRALSLAPASLPLEQKLEAAGEGAVLGFVFGAVGTQAK